MSRVRIDWKLIADHALNYDGTCSHCGPDVSSSDCPAKEERDKLFSHLDWLQHRLNSPYVGRLERAALLRSYRYYCEKWRYFGLTYVFGLTYALAR